MVVFLNTSYALRRLALLSCVFIACVAFLRSTSSSYNDYLPSWKTPQFFSPDAASDPLSDEDIRPDRIFTKPDDILPQLQDIPAEWSRPATSHDDLPTSSPRSRLSLEMQEILSWDPPVEIKEHYPPYDAYRDRDYDPNRWESFEQNNGFYENGTTRKLPMTVQTPVIYEVYPEYNSADWLEKWRGEFVSCESPSGVPYNTSLEGFVMAYDGVPSGFPKPDVGSYEAVGLDGNVCFERNSRLGPYGLDQGSVDFSKVKWGRLQNNCLGRNSARYRLSNAPVLAPGIVEGLEEMKESLAHEVKPRAGEESLQYKSRTAILIRTWDTYEYQENDHQAIRSLISELSLQSGAEYHVFLFVNIKDSKIPIFTDPSAYQKALEDHVPEEFRDIAILWTEKVCTDWYPQVGEWSVYFQQFMPLQWFSEMHPEFDYVWNWEMDARYIGHHYHFLEEIATFSRQQPRKYLWERNSRYYFPAAHGSYDDFVRETHEIISDSPELHTVWGPQPWTKDQKTAGPEPPTSEAADKFEWGVEEEADFITLLPMWDPRETWWAYRDKLWGYPASETSTEERPFPHIPRRTFINTLSRFSRMLLHAMHEENKLGVSMASEMWPSSTALQHGLKAVYAPHPIWLSHHWPAEYLDLVYNADGWGAGSQPGTNIDNGHGVAYDAKKERLGQRQEGTGPNGEGRAGRWSQERDSVYSPDREHNFGGWSWYFWSDFPKTLYWRWLGWSSSFSIVTIEGQQSTDSLKDENWSEWENGHGRMCLPGMLLHPVKSVKAPPKTEVEEIEENYEDEEEEDDASDSNSSDNSTPSEPSPVETTTTEEDKTTDDTTSKEEVSGTGQTAKQDSSADDKSSSTPNAPPGIELPAAPQQYDSPFHDVSPLDDNTLLEDARLQDLGPPQSFPHPQTQPPQPQPPVTEPELEAAAPEPVPVPIDTSASHDAANIAATSKTMPENEEEINIDDVDARPLHDELPPHADFYSMTPAPAPVDTAIETEADAEPPEAAEAEPATEAPEVIDDGITVDEIDSFDNSNPNNDHPSFGPPPVPGTDNGPGYDELFGAGDAHRLEQPPTSDDGVAVDTDDSFDNTNTAATQPPHVPGTDDGLGYDDQFGAGDAHRVELPPP